MNKVSEADVIKEYCNHLGFEDVADIDYSSKQELLDKLRTMRDGLQEVPKEERLKVRPNLAVSIQQAFYASEYELLRFKKTNNHFKGDIHADKTEQ